VLIRHCEPYLRRGVPCSVCIFIAAPGLSASYSPRDDGSESQAVGISVERGIQVPVKTWSNSRPAGPGADTHEHGSPRRLRPAEQLAAYLTGGGSLLLTGANGAAAVLAGIADVLAKRRTRVLRVSPPLDLQGFMEQVGRTGQAAGDDDVERGFNALTTLDPSCDRIVLLVDDAHLLPHTTLFYLQFVLRADPPLHLAFAGRPEIAGTLALEGFAGLRGRFTLQLAMPEPSPAPAGSAVQAGQHSRIGRVIARVLARSAAYTGLWTTPSRPRRPAPAIKGVPAPAPGQMMP